MKVNELTEQLHRRKSPEELAAIKAAPDYWKTEFRNEFNDIIKKYGATSKEIGKQKDPHFLWVDRYISVLPSNDDDFLRQDVRIRGLLKEIGKLLYRQVQMGNDVVIGPKYWNHTGPVGGADVNGFFKTPPSLDDITERIYDSVMKDELLKKPQGSSEQDRKLPVRFDLRFGITNPTSKVQ